MAARELTSFEQILLGLICMAPSSGYGLKRIFAGSPMGLYQPSSGTLYPALRRLESSGLIRARSAEAGPTARQRRVYEPTESGRAANTRWLRSPVAPATVGNDLGLHLMRFVMMEHWLPRHEVLGFLRSLADALAALTAGLERYAQSPNMPDGHPRLALGHGLAVHRASLRWTEETIAALCADGPEGPTSEGGE